MSQATIPDPEQPQGEVVLSVHIGPRRRPPSPADVPGLRYAEALTPAALGRRVPAPRAGRTGLICGWTDDESLDAFLADDKRGRLLAEGWHVRLQPLRASGSWSALPELETAHVDGGEQEPVAVLTLGRLRISQGIRFLRTSSPAERAVLEAPGLLASTGLARPPIVSTFSLWRSAAEMADYAYGKGNDRHKAAIEAQQKKPFHTESIFARFRPYRSAGEWDGADPFAGIALPARSS